MPPGRSAPVNAALILVLGILSIVVCGILRPIGWVMGNNAMATLNAGGGDESQRSTANIGRILGIVGTVLLVLNVLWVIFGGGLAILSGLMSGGAAGTSQ